jgi:tRNA dimethylallyltransferase
LTGSPASAAVSSRATPAPGQGARVASVLIVAGPTACGKSALALRIAEEMGGTVINADSLQLYRDLSILTARPGAAEMARAPHRLYGVLSAIEPCSAGRWRAMGVGEISAAFAAGRLPVVTGGTGMYLSALVQGLAPVPPVPTAVREEAKALMAELGPARFHARLAGLDPVMAARLRPTDTQRLMRAFEVVRATGRSLASFQAEGAPRAGEEKQKAEPEPGQLRAGPRFMTVVLNPPREVLYAACDLRFDAMMAHGALDEARAILALDLPETAPVLKAVGLRELLAHLRGEMGLEGRWRRQKGRPATMRSGR